MTPFRISLDRTERHLDLEMSGYWTDEVMGDFERASAPHSRAFSELRSPKTCLVDARSFGPQSQAIVKRHQELIAKLGQSGRADATAVVLSGAILKMQVSRAAPTAGLQTFNDIDEARDWLRTARSAK